MRDSGSVASVSYKQGHQPAPVFDVTANTFIGTADKTVFPFPFKFSEI